MFIPFIRCSIKYYIRLTVIQSICRRGTRERLYRNKEFAEEAIGRDREKVRVDSREKLIADTSEGPAPSSSHR